MNEQTGRYGKQRVAAGIALSIAAHGALIFALRTQEPPHVDNGAAPREMLFVQLRALPPPTPVAPAPMPQVLPERAPALKPTRRAAPAKAVRAPQTEVIAMPESAAAAAAATPADEGRFTVAPVQEIPAFDPDAAKAFARSIATRPDPARAGTVGERLPEKPLQTETKAARAIASAKRRDCKDGLPGGLLGPLLMLLDKKDSGCKW